MMSHLERRGIEYDDQLAYRLAVTVYNRLSSTLDLTEFPRVMTVSDVQVHLEEHVSDTRAFWLREIRQARMYLDVELKQRLDKRKEAERTPRNKDIFCIDDDSKEEDGNLPG